MKLINSRIRFRSLDIYKVFILTIVILFSAELHSQIYREPTKGMALSGVIKEYHDITIPVPYAHITVKGTDIEVDADGRGFFVVGGFAGKLNKDGVILVITAEGYEELEVAVGLGGEEIGIIFMHPLRRDINPITVNDLMPSLHENNSISTFGSTALFWDPGNTLMKGANLNLGLLGYKMRGYDWDRYNFHINGVNMNEPETGYAFAGLFAGLNDFTKKGNGSNKLVDNSMFYGDLGGYNNININPLSYREQFKATYGFSNSLFSHQLTASYSSGVLYSGWAVNVMASARTGNGYMDGTDYKGLSYLFSAAKELDEDIYLNLFVMGAPTEMGLQNHSTEKEFDAYGEKYNSAWGTKINGKDLNSRKNKYHMPIFGIENYWGDIISEVANLRTSLSFSFGNNAQTALNWTGDVVNPIPGRYNSIDKNGQIDWENIINTDSTQLQSKYILENRISNRTLLSFNAVFDVFDWKKFETTSGIEAKLYNGNFKKEADDMLGGSYWIDVDKFDPGLTVPASFYQNNINMPDRNVHADETFGYNYSISHKSAKAWTMWRYYWNLFKFSAGASATYQDYKHTSEMKNGKSTDKGSLSKSFIDYTGKVGAAYKINKYSDVEINAYYAKKSPGFSNAFLAPRVSNAILEDLKQEQIISGELNYSLHSASFDINASLFYTMFTDRTLIRSDYFHRDLSNKNMALYGVNQTHMGVEISAKYSFNNELSATLAFSKGIYKYKSNPNSVLYQENIAEVINSDTLNMTDFYVGGTPQMAISFGATYAPKKWWIGGNINFSSDNYADVNPYRYTITTREEGEEEALVLTPQEKLKSLFTIDLHGGYTYEFGERRKKAIGLNVNIQNVLGTKGYLGAYEPFGLINEANQEDFATRYARAYGRTMFLILSFRF